MNKHTVSHTTVYILAHTRLLLPSKEFRKATMVTAPTATTTLAAIDAYASMWLAKDPRDDLLELVIPKIAACTSIAATYILGIK